MINLSCNQIGDKGLLLLLDVLSKGHVVLWYIAVFDNTISDVGGARLSEYVRQQKEPVEQIHLSHNQCTFTASRQ